MDTKPKDETQEETQAEEQAVKSILDNLGAKMDSQLEEKLDNVKTELDAEIKKWGEKMTKESSSSKVALDVEEYRNWAKSIRSGQKGEFSFDINIAPLSQVKASDMSVSDSVEGELPLPELDPMVSRDPQREPFVEDLVQVGTIGSNLDAWIETTDESGNPAPVAELARLPQKSYDFARKTAEVKKIGVYTKHSAEMAEDLPNLISEIRNFLIGDLRRVVDTQLLSGDGSGENLTGILENAEDYAAGDFAGTITEPNRFDVIETAANQVRVALHNPTTVVVHPTDRAKMRLSKADDGHYVMPPFIAADGTQVSGLRVVANTGIDQGKFLVGDFSKAVVKYRRGLTIEMSNTDEDDFTRDRFTTRATVRLVHRVRENDYEAFVYGDFGDAIDALAES